MADVEDVCVSLWILHLMFPERANLHEKCLTEVAMSATPEQLERLGKAYPNLVIAAKMHREIN